MILSPKKYHIILILCFLLPSFGCRHNTQRSKTSPFTANQSKLPDLEEIKKRGKLVVLTENSSTSYYLYKGQPMGYEFEILEMFTDFLKVELEIKLIDNMDQVLFLLNEGVGDIAACNLTVTKERSELVNFTSPYIFTKQVLVQKKPNNWEHMSQREIDMDLIRQPLDLMGKEVHVRKNSSFYSRLIHLSEEIGGEIDIVSVRGDVETEELIRMVSEGEILYTIADENVAKINQTYYPNLDIRTAISLPQQIAWAVRKTSPDLLEEINKWLYLMKDNSTFNYVYNKYFEFSKEQKYRVISEYSSVTGSRISEYDELIKQYADTINWDWRLLAALIYQESKFDPRAVSWAGAFGIMQLMPSTAKRYNVTINSSVEDQIYAGVDKLRRLENYWSNHINDPEVVLKFVLASYNAGLGHVYDASNLAKKYGKDPFAWDDNVEYYLLMKAKSKFYTDDVVLNGYCRGTEPVNYVKEILHRYQQYQQVII